MKKLRNFKRSWNCDHSYWKKIRCRKNNFIKFAETAGSCYLDKVNDLTAVGRSIKRSSNEQRYIYFFTFWHKMTQHNSIIAAGILANLNDPKWNIHGFRNWIWAQKIIAHFDATIRSMGLPNSRTLVTWPIRKSIVILLYILGPVLYQWKSIS